MTKKSSKKIPPSHKPRLKIAALSSLIIGSALVSQPLISSNQPPPAPPPHQTIDVPTPPVPILAANSIQPQLTSKAAIVIDQKSNTILYQKNPDLDLLPASTTKIMTALIALETYDINQVITVTEEENSIGQTINLVKGEQITVENLIKGALIGSGNDAALALARAYPYGGYSGFVQAMNQKAARLNLENTQYQNVSGVESPGHITTVKDLANLTQQALKNPIFKQIVATQTTTITSSDKLISHYLTNTNQLLGQLDGVEGVKTGWTDNAMECLVTSVTRDGHSIITVILGSNDRFGESTQLIEWTYSNYTWEYL